MSRIGQETHSRCPKGVTVNVTPDAVEVKGPKGTLKQRVPPGVKFEVKGDRAHRDDARASDPELSKFHGLARSLMANAVARRHRGLQEGARHRRRRLPRRGQGQAGGVRARLFASGGVRHPGGIDIAIDKQTHVTVTGIDRQLVGQVAANIRRLRKPDPYKQKGVRYTGEVLKKKVGKTGAK